jgi:hypothetical protein
MNYLTASFQNIHSTFEKMILFWWEDRKIALVSIGKP